MATVTSSTCGLWSLILTTSLTLTGCWGALPHSPNSTKTYTVGSILKYCIIPPGYAPKVEPFLMEREEGHMGADAEYEGFIPDLLNEIADHLGVNFKFILQPDGKFGDKNQDLKWDGLVGSLIRTEVDLAAGPLTITSIRHRVIDFSKPFMSTGLVMVISGSLRGGSAPMSTSRVGLIFKPFSTIAWFMLIAALLMIVVFAVIILRINPQSEKAGHIASVSTLLTTCSSGGQYSGCVLRTTMVLFVVLTVVLYTAGVVSLLLYTTRMENAQRPRQQQESDYEHLDIADIVHSGQYKIAVTRDSASQAFFKHSSVPLYWKIYEKMTYVENITAGFDLIRKDPGYAFITDRALIEYYISRRPYCGLHIVGTTLTANGYGFGYPIGSALREIIDLSILSMRESGLLQSLHRKWWHDRAQCNKPTVPSKKKLPPASPGIDSMTLGGVLIILAIGLLLAVGVAVVERFLHLRSSKVNIGSRPLRDSSDGQPLHIGGSTNRDMVNT